MISEGNHIEVFGPLKIFGLFLQRCIAASELLLCEGDCCISIYYVKAIKMHCTSL